MCSYPKDRNEYNEKNVIFFEIFFTFASCLSILDKRYRGRAGGVYSGFIISDYNQPTDECCSFPALGYSMLLLKYQLKPNHLELSRPSSGRC